jgi:regulator of protease activity HflC (stomatin/prohibitin superfamily)
MIINFDREFYFLVGILSLVIIPVVIFAYAYGKRVVIIPDKMVGLLFRNGKYRNTLLPGFNTVFPFGRKIKLVSIEEYEMDKELYHQLNDITLGLKDYEKHRKEKARSMGIPMSEYIVFVVSFIAIMASLLMMKFCKFIYQKSICLVVTFCLYSFLNAYIDNKKSKGQSIEVKKAKKKQFMHAIINALIVLAFIVAPIILANNNNYYISKEYEYKYCLFLPAAVAIILKSIVFVPKYGETIIEKNGKYHATLEPGIRLVSPLSSVKVVDTNEITASPDALEFESVDNINYSLLIGYTYKMTDIDAAIHNNPFGPSIVKNIIYKSVSDIAKNITYPDFINYLNEYAKQAQIDATQTLAKLNYGYEVTSVTLSINQ